MRSDDFMNAEDVARYLNLGKNTVYQLAKSGKIASYHVGRKLKFTLEDVEAYVASTRQDSGSGNPTHDRIHDTMRMRAQRTERNTDTDSLIEAASFGMLEGEPFVIAGNDVSADVVASALNASGIPASRLPQVCYTSLVSLYAGQADAAVVSLYDQASNGYNIAYVQRLAPGTSVVVVRLCERKQGFIVRMGNPRKLNTWGSLLREGVRLSNREKGSSARVLLDEKLRAMEARSESIEGYDTHAFTASTAIRRVAAGIADVAIGTEREMRAVSGVQFVPLQTERVDLVIRKTTRTRATIHEIANLLASERVHHDFESLEFCDTTRLGTIVYES